MLLFNFVCVFYLMVLVNSHTISKSIAEYNFDDKSDSLTDIDYTRGRKNRHNVFLHKYRREEQEGTTEPIGLKKRIVIASSDTSTAKTPTTHGKTKANQKFWRKFKMKNKKNKDGRMKRNKLKRITINPKPPNRLTSHRNYRLSQHAQRRREALFFVDSKMGGNLIKDKKNGMSVTATAFKKPLLIPSPNQNTLTDITTKLRNLKLQYGKNKQPMPKLSNFYEYRPYPDPTPTTEFTTTEPTEYPGTAQLEELLNGIKSRAIQMYVGQNPAVTELLTNTVNEVTFRADPMLSHFGPTSSVFSLTTFVTLTNLDEINKRTVNDSTLVVISDKDRHNISVRSCKEAAYTIAQSVEDKIQEKLKKVYNKVKGKVTKECEKDLDTVKSTWKDQKNKLVGQIDKATDNVRSVSKPCKEKKEKLCTKKPKKNKKRSSETREVRAGEVTNQMKKTTEPQIETTPTVDDFALLSLYEQILMKTHEDNVMKMLTTNSFVQDGRIYKRNPTPDMTDATNDETSGTTYDTSTSSSEANNSTDMVLHGLLEGNGTTPTGNGEETSFESLVDKIYFNDYVNGYKHYLNFQKEEAAANFSDLIKFQAHKHHKVDDIGKFILEKIPQIPTRKRRYFFDDSDIDYQDVSTKGDDSWFKKHFYMFIDNGPPKKYHTSETVNFKDVSKGKGADSIPNTVTLPGRRALEEFDMDAISLEDLSKALENRKHSVYFPVDRLQSQTPSKPKPAEDRLEEGGLTFKIYAPHAISKWFGGNKGENKKQQKTGNKEEDDSVFKSGRLKRDTNLANFLNNTSDLAVRSTTKATTLADVTKTNNKKNEGCVSIQVVSQPTSVVKLRSNPKQSKFKKLLKKLHLASYKEKRKRQARVYRFNPFKKLKDIFNKNEDERSRSMSIPENNDYDFSHIDTFRPHNIPNMEDLRNQVPNITNEFGLQDDDQLLVKVPTPKEITDKMAEVKEISEKVAEVVEPKPQTEKVTTTSQKEKEETTYAFTIRTSMTVPLTTIRTTVTESITSEFTTFQDDIMNINIKSAPDLSLQLEKPELKLLHGKPAEKPVPQHKLYHMSLQDIKSEIDKLNSKLHSHGRLDIPMKFTHKTYNSPFIKPVNIMSVKDKNWKPTLHDQPINPIILINKKPTLYDQTINPVILINRKSTLYDQPINPVILINRKQKKPKSQRPDKMPEKPVLGIKQFPIQDNFEMKSVGYLTKLYNFDDYLHETSDLEDNEDLSTEQETKNLRSSTAFPRRKQPEYKDIKYKIRDDFNDLMLWHGDILSYDSLTTPSWQDLINSLQNKHFTTPDLVSLENELTEIRNLLDSFKETNLVLPPLKDTIKNMSLESSTNLAHNVKYRAKIRELQAYNKMKRDDYDNGNVNTMTVITEFDETRPNEYYTTKEYEKRNFERKSSTEVNYESIPVETTLLSYDDTFNFYSEPSIKLSRNPIMMNKTKNKLLVKTKTNKQPQQSFSTPFPMTMRKFEMFLKQNDLDVKSVTAPILSSPNLEDLNARENASLHKKAYNLTDTTTEIDDIEPEDQIEYLNREMDYVQNDLSYLNEGSVNRRRKKDEQEEITKRNDKDKEVEITIINFDDANRLLKELNTLKSKINREKGKTTLKEQSGRVFKTNNRDRSSGHVFQPAVDLIGPKHNAATTLTGRDNDNDNNVHVYGHSFHYNFIFGPNKSLKNFKPITPPQKAHRNNTTPSDDYGFNCTEACRYVRLNPKRRGPRFGRAERTTSSHTKATKARKTSPAHHMWSKYLPMFRKKISFSHNITTNVSKTIKSASKDANSDTGKELKARSSYGKNQGTTEPMTTDYTSPEFETKLEEDYVESFDEALTMHRVIPPYKPVLDTPMSNKFLTNTLSPTLKPDPLIPEMSIPKIEIPDLLMPPTPVQVLMRTTDKHNKKLKEKPVHPDNVIYLDDIPESHSQDYYELGLKKMPQKLSDFEISTYEPTPRTQTFYNFLMNKMKDKNSKVKRHAIPETYTARDVAAIEVVIDLFKNLFSATKSLKTTEKTVTKKTKKVKPPFNTTPTTNSIQVHIAIPYDVDDDGRKRSVDPQRIRKVFSARMATPVDLEYQIHSLERQSSTTASDDVALSPGMYLVVDNKTGTFSLKPVQCNEQPKDNKPDRDLEPAPDIKLAKNLKPAKNVKTVRDLKSHQKRTKMSSKVTLSKDFLAAINEQLLKLYENLTSSINHHKILKRNNPHWEKVKKIFGHDKVCGCKANKTMCKSCADCDGVVRELTISFENLASYMKDHCTEIQTFFWMNPKGGKQLRDLVNKIDRSLSDYYKRINGKCHGRPCPTFTTCLDKRNVNKTVGELYAFLDIIRQLSGNIEMILSNLPYSPNLKDAGDKFVEATKNCEKSLEKRTTLLCLHNEICEGKPNEYSLDNINVNIICDPNVRKTTVGLTEFQYLPTTLLTLNYNGEKTYKKKKIRNFFNVSKKKPRNKLFTYYVVNTTPKISKREIYTNQLESPLIADTGGSFWHDYISKNNDMSSGTQSQIEIATTTAATNAKKETNRTSNKQIRSIRDKIKKLHPSQMFQSSSPTFDKGKHYSSTSESKTKVDDFIVTRMESLSHNINELMKIFEMVYHVSKNHTKSTTHKPASTHKTTKSKKTHNKKTKDKKHKKPIKHVNKENKVATSNLGDTSTIEEELNNKTKKLNEKGNLLVTTTAVSLNQEQDAVNDAVHITESSTISETKDKSLINKLKHKTAGIFNNMKQCRQADHLIAETNKGQKVHYTVLAKGKNEELINITDISNGNDEKQRQTNGDNNGKGITEMQFVQEPRDEATTQITSETGIESNSFGTATLIGNIDGTQENVKSQETTGNTILKLTTNQPDQGNDNIGGLYKSVIDFNNKLKRQNDDQTMDIEEIMMTYSSLPKTTLVEEVGDRLFAFNSFPTNPSPPKPSRLNWYKPRPSSSKLFSQPPDQQPVAYTPVQLRKIIPKKPTCKRPLNEMKKTTSQRPQGLENALLSKLKGLELHPPASVMDDKQPHLDFSIKVIPSSSFKGDIQNTTNSPLKRYVKK